MASLLVKLELYCQFFEGDSVAYIHVAYKGSSGQNFFIEFTTVVVGWITAIAQGG